VRQALDEDTVARARRGLVEVRERVEAEAPRELAEQALGQLDEFESSLEHVVDAGDADLQAEGTGPESGEGLPGRMDRVRSWFLEHLPSVAGDVSSLVVHPIVGRLVQVVGDGAAKALSARFGLDPESR